MYISSSISAFKMPAPRRNGAALRPWPLPSPKASGLTRSLAWASTFPCSVHLPPARTLVRQVGTCTTRPCRPVRFFACRAFLCQPRAYPSAKPPAYKRSSRPFQACPVSFAFRHSSHSGDSITCRRFLGSGISSVACIAIWPPLSHANASSRRFPLRLRSSARNNATLLPPHRCGVFDSSYVMTIWAGYCRRW